MAGDSVYAIHAQTDGTWTRHRVLAWCLLEVDDHGDIYRDIVPVVAIPDCPSALFPDTDDELIAVVHAHEIEERREDLNQLAQARAAEHQRLARRRAGARAA